jgi:hypothetical protein
MTPADLRRLHKYMLEIEKVTVISDEMRAVVEGEWSELAHKMREIPRYRGISSAVRLVRVRDGLAGWSGRIRRANALRAVRADVHGTLACSLGFLWGPAA